MMNEELYLIAHKLRGAPTFDIAIQMEMDDEVWWILPSTGHRAYPYWHCELYNCTAIVRPNSTRRICIEALDDMPADLPDFYQVTTPQIAKAENRMSAEAGRSLLESLGLAKDRPHPSVSGKIERRI